MRSGEVVAIAERIRARARRCEELLAAIAELDELDVDQERVAWLRARRDAFYDSAELVAIAGELEAAAERVDA